MKIHLVFLASFVCVVLGKDYTGYQVLRITPSSLEHREWLRAIQHTLGDEVDFWSEVRNAKGSTVDIMVPPNFLDQFRAMLNDQDLDYHIMHHDVGKTITEQHEERRKRRSVSTDAGFDYSMYHEYDEIQDWVNDQVAEYSSIVSRFELPFKSYEGRTISGIEIRGTGGSAGTRLGVWFEGGIHAREWISPATVMYFTSMLLQNYTAGVEEVKEMFDKMDWYILPSLNADGYVYTHTDDRLWRKTRSSNTDHTGSGCTGTDPNRNWPYKWGGEGTSAFPCSNVYRGEDRLSEIEIEGVVEFLREKKFGGQDFIWFIDWHSYSQLLLSPWSYTASVPNPPDTDDQVAAGNAFAQAVFDYSGMTYTAGPSAELLYAAAGASNDFGYAPFSEKTKKEGGLGAKYTYVVELRDEGQTGFLLPEDQILATGEENFYGVIAMANYIIETEGL